MNPTRGGVGHGMSDELTLVLRTGIADRSDLLDERDDLVALLRDRGYDFLLSDDGVYVILVRSTSKASAFKIRP